MTRLYFLYTNGKWHQTNLMTAKLHTYKKKTVYKTDKKLLLYHSYIDVNNNENRNMSQW